MLDINDYVNEAPPSSSIGSLTKSLRESNHQPPIDLYVQSTRRLVEYGTADRLSEMPALGGLLLLGSVSATEAYFRSVLSACLDICPECRRIAAEKQINLGGVLWHGQDGFRRSAFEHLSFSSCKELKSAAREYLDFELKDASFRAPLSEFEIACNLRHGLVHNGGILPGRNAVKLGIRRFEKDVEIVVDYAFLQRIVAAVDTLVLLLNRELFSLMCLRWATVWRKREDWDASRENALFRAIWDIFFSKELNKHRQGRSKLTATNCMKMTRIKFNL